MLDYVFVKKSNLPDGENITKAIKEATDTGVYTVVVKGGNWKIENTILLPDYLHLVFDGAVIEFIGEGFAYANFNAVTSYKNVIAAQQKGITISGENNAKLVGGSVLLHNVKNCTIENLVFEKSTCGVVLTSTLGVRLKNLEFLDCDSGIRLGVGASDVMINDVTGKGLKQLIYADSREFAEYKRLYHPAEIRNVIARGLFAQAENIVKIVGNSERLIFSDIKGKVTSSAFNIENGKHIAIDNIAVDGKLIDGNYSQNQVVISNQV